MHCQTVSIIITCRAITLVIAKFNYQPHGSTTNVSNLPKATKTVSEAEIQSQVSLSLKPNFLNHGPVYGSGSRALHLQFAQIRIGVAEGYISTLIHWLF